MNMLIDIQEETYNKIRRGEVTYPADVNVAIFAIETATPLDEDCAALIQQKINKKSVMECPKCGCRNSSEALKCWWCHYELKSEVNK